MCSQAYCTMNSECLCRIAHQVIHRGKIYIAHKQITLAARLRTSIPPPLCSISSSSPPPPAPGPYTTAATPSATSRPPPTPLHTVAPRRMDGFAVLHLGQTSRLGPSVYRQVFAQIILGGRRGERAGLSGSATAMLARRPSTGIWVGNDSWVF